MTTGGERIIATYKTLKGALQLVLAGAVIVVVLTGHGAALHDLAVDLWHHASRRWSIALARAIAGRATPHGFLVAALALAFDGVLTSVEGWALRRGHWWGRWTVVVASGALLPFEVEAFVRREHWIELAAFAFNLAIVVYLARQALAARHAKTTS